MKYNTVLTSYPHQAIYQTWEAELSNEDGREYRIYADPVVIPCRVAVNAVGIVTLFAADQLQAFGLLQGFRDSSSEDEGVGREFLREDVYSVIKPTPLINPMGTVYGYAHTLTVPTTEQVNGPIDPRPPRWDQSA